MANESQPTESRHQWTLQDYAEHLQYYAAKIASGRYRYEDVHYFTQCARTLKDRGASSELAQLNAIPVVKTALQHVDAHFNPGASRPTNELQLENIKLASDAIIPETGVLYEAENGNILIAGDTKGTDGTEGELVLASAPVASLSDGTPVPGGEELAKKQAFELRNQGQRAHLGMGPNDTSVFFTSTAPKSDWSTYEAADEHRATRMSEWTGKRSVQGPKYPDNISGLSKKDLPRELPEFIPAVTEKTTELLRLKDALPASEADAPSAPWQNFDADAVMSALQTEIPDTTVLQDGLTTLATWYETMRTDLAASPEDRRAALDALLQVRRAALDKLSGNKLASDFLNNIPRLVELSDLITPTYSLPADSLSNVLRQRVEDSTKNQWGTIETLERTAQEQDELAKERGIEVTSDNSQVQKLQNYLLKPVLDKLPQEYRSSFEPWLRQIPLQSLAKELDRLKALPAGANAQKEFFTSLRTLSGTVKDSPSPFNQLVSDRIAKIEEPRVREVASNMFTEAQLIPGVDALTLVEPILAKPSIMENPMQMARELTRTLDQRVAQLSAQDKKAWYAKLEEQGFGTPQNIDQYFSQRLLDHIAYSFVGEKQRETFGRLLTTAYEKGMTPDTALNILEQSYTREARDNSSVMTQNVIQGMNQWAKDSEIDVDFAETAALSGVDALPEFLRTPAKALMTFAHEQLGVGWDTIVGTASWASGMGKDVKEGVMSLFQADMRYSPHTRLDEQIHDRFIYMDRMQATNTLRERQTQAGVTNLQKIATKFGATLPAETARLIVETVTSPTFLAVQNQLIPQLKNQFPQFAELIDKAVEIKNQIFTGFNGDYMSLYWENTADARFASEFNTLGQFVQFAAAGSSAKNSWARAEDYSRAMKIMREKKGFRLPNESRLSTGDTLRYLQDADKELTDHLMQSIETRILQEDLEAGDFTDIVYNADGTISADTFLRYYNEDGEEISYEDFEKLPEGKGYTRADEKGDQIIAQRNTIQKITRELLDTLQKQATSADQQTLLNSWRKLKPTQTSALEDRIAYQLAQDLPATVTGYRLYERATEVVNQQKQIQTAAMGFADYAEIFKPGEEAAASDQLQLMLGSTNQNDPKAADQAARNLLWGRTNQMTIQETLSMSQAVGQTLQKLGMNPEQIGAATEFAQLLHYSTMSKAGNAGLDPARSRAQAAQIAGRVYGSRDMANVTWLLSRQDKDLSNELQEVKKRLKDGTATIADYRLLQDRNKLYEGWEAEDKSGFELMFSLDAQNAMRKNLSAEDRNLAAAAAFNMNFQKDVMDKFNAEHTQQLLETSLANEESSWGAAGTSSKDVADAITALVQGKFHTDRIKALLSGSGEGLTESEKKQLRDAGVTQDRIAAIDTISAATSKEGMSGYRPNFNAAVETAKTSALKSVGVTEDTYNSLGTPDRTQAHLLVRTEDLMKKINLPHNTNLQEALNATDGLATFAASLFKGFGGSVNMEQMKEILNKHGLALLLNTASYAASADDFNELLFQNSDPGIETIRQLAEAVKLTDKDGSTPTVTNENKNDILNQIRTRLEGANSEEIRQWGANLEQQDFGVHLLYVLNQLTRSGVISGMQVLGAVTGQDSPETSVAESANADTGSGTAESASGGPTTGPPVESGSVEPPGTAIPESITLEDDSSSGLSPEDTSAVAEPVTPEQSRPTDAELNRNSSGPGPTSTDTANNWNVLQEVLSEDNALRVVVVNPSSPAHNC